MKQKFQCTHCDLQFENSDECVHHEISHFNFREDFQQNLVHALGELDEKYQKESHISLYNFRVFEDWSAYGGNEFETEFEFQITTSNAGKNETFKKTLHSPYSEEFAVLKKEDLVKMLEKEFFMPKFLSKYEGVFTFEDYCGGHGADDYMIGDSYMSTIFEAFKDKKVKIEIVD